jgi:hypothetical protein
MLNARQKRANTTLPTCKRMNVAITIEFIDAMPIFGIPSMGVYPTIDNRIEY